LQDGSFWFYEYDNLGQLRSGKKYWSDGTPVPGQQFEYSHDDIGNRTQTKAGGDQSGTGLRSASYSANSLNQYTSRGVPGAVDILGIAPASASVTVNSSPADYRRGEYFQELVTVANGANPVWQAISVSTSGGGSASGNVFVPRTPEDFDDPATPSVNEGYDLDGNQLRDGRWNYTWDGENLLTKLESLANAPSGSKRRLEFEYDWQGRRIKKKVTNLDTSSVLLDTKFLYDGWNLIAELNATNNAVIRSYMWGLDLSGAMQGAAGVGGLLVVNDTANGVNFAAYDGNGNVAALVKGTDGTISAQYEYGPFADGPFAEPIRVTGPMGKANPIRFSSKYTDDESDFLYYGHRYYNPSTGRWLNRDPIRERGGINLYCFVNNDPPNGIDLHGLYKHAIHDEITRVAVTTAKLNTNRKCKTRIHTILMMGNDSQDAPLSKLWDNRRHYNRLPTETEEQGNFNYFDYINNYELPRFTRAWRIRQNPTAKKLFSPWAGYCTHGKTSLFTLKGMEQLTKTGMLGPKVKQEPLMHRRTYTHKPI
jgi:RHS repeat-associated protein